MSPRPAQRSVLASASRAGSASAAASAAESDGSANGSDHGSSSLNRGRSYAAARGAPLPVRGDHSASVGGSAGRIRAAARSRCRRPAMPHPTCMTSPSPPPLREPGLLLAQLALGMAADAAPLARRIERARARARAGGRVGANRRSGRAFGRAARSTRRAPAGDRTIRRSCRSRSARR